MIICFKNIFIHSMENIDIDNLCYWINNTYNFATNNSIVIYPKEKIKLDKFIKQFHKKLNGTIIYINKFEKYFVYIYKNENFKINLNYFDWNEKIMWKIEGDVIY